MHAVEKWNTSVLVAPLLSCTAALAKSFMVSENVEHRVLLCFGFGLSVPQGLMAGSLGLGVAILSGGTQEEVMKLLWASPVDD